jgi:hypothetical protein
MPNSIGKGLAFACSCYDGIKKIPFGHHKGRLAETVHDQIATDGQCYNQNDGDQSFQTHIVL